MKKVETFTLPESRFLSNFYPYKNKEGDKYPHKISIEFEGICYDCTENAYQAAKSLNSEVRKLIAAMSPFESKKYWEDKKDQVRPDWNQVKDELMKNFNEQKFYNHPELGKMLKNTEDAILEEGNTWGDVYWGVCNGVGENKLGKLLMEIRSNL